MLATGEELLLRNVELLVPRQPDLARDILAATPADVEWLDTPEGPSAVYAGRALASRRTPLAESRQWAARVDVAGHAAIVCCGFGLGLHLLALSDRQTKGDTVFVLETDVPLLRSVLERIDLTKLLAKPVFIITDASDIGGLAGAMGMCSRSVALGVQITDHAPSLPRLGEARGAFLKAVNATVASTRTVATSELLQTESTFRNLLHNLDHYATRPGIGPWAGVLKGRPAVLVAAGPSLSRTIDQLARPGVRERVLIVAVQTVLKPLLARGIRPHIVCALDHHEISARFYEGLTRESVRGVTLIVEPKVNPAVPVAFPGEIRIASDNLLDTLLGESLARPLGGITPGTTVAHLAYYLARYLGCEPVALTGMDLGFTDGQYYSAGAAIHSVWAGELSSLNTLEMLEWQRVKRMGGALRTATDILDRPIYTDEQMHTYLQHFLAVFKADAGKGLTTLDATEGGVRKENAEPRKLRDLMDTWLTEHIDKPTVDEVLASATDPSAPASPGKRIEAVRDRVRRTRQDLFTIEQMSKQAESLLIEAREHQEDLARVERIVHTLDGMRARITTLDPAWALLNVYNALGSFKRWRADRALRLDENSISGKAVQLRQVDRDIVNVQWLGDAATRFAKQLDQALDTLAGQPRITSDIRHSDQIETAATKRSLTCRAVVPVLMRTSGLGTPRDLRQTTLAGHNVLALTVRRLLRIEGSSGVTLVTDQPDEVRCMLGPLASDKRISIHAVAAEPRPWALSVIRAARAFTRSCYRGGLGSATCYDEVLDAATVLSVLEATDSDAALICGSDWPLLDPAIATSLIERLAETPDEASQPRMVFTQATPGLAPLLLPRRTARMLASARASAGIHAGLSGLTGYLPATPAMDPIAHASCVKVSPAVRDALVRCIADTPGRAAWLGDALLAAGLDPLLATAEQISTAIGVHALAHPSPWHLRLDLGTSGDWLDERIALCEIEQFNSSCNDGAITIEGDVLGHPAWQAIWNAAATTAPVHLRCGPLTRAGDVDHLLQSHASIVSIDLVSLRAETFAKFRPDLLAALGADAHSRTQRHFEALANRAPIDPIARVRTPWIVPRLVRSDDTYADIESFFDNGMHTLSWAIIEPLAHAREGERIVPLALPALARQRAAVEEIRVGPAMPGGGGR